MKNEKIVGNIMVIISAALWGITGVVAQYLYETNSISVDAVVIIKLLITGSVLLLYCLYRYKKLTIQVWSNKKDAIRMILLALLGITGTQYAYFSAIAASDAPTATVLLYTYPVLVIIVMAIKNRHRPSWIDKMCIICAVLGTFVIATHGRATELVISGKALFWGLVASACNCYFSIYSMELTKKYGSVIVNGWGMMIGGIVVSMVKYPEVISFHFSMEVMICLGAIVVLGTMVSFVLYLSGIQIIGAVRASVLGAVEPLSALLVAVLFLNQKIVLADIAGVLGIIVSVLLPVICRKK